MYRTIATLPFDRFIDCQVDKNLAALIKSGLPTHQELLITWDNIQQEAADASGDSEHKMYLISLKEICHLKVKLQVIYDMVEMLRKVYYKPFADRLNKLLYTKCKFDYTDVDGYHKELQSCLNRSKSIKINIDLKEMNLEAKKPKEGETVKKPTREYYQSVLITLSNHAHYPLHPNQLTTYEYFDRVRRWNEHCKQSDPKNKNK